MEEKQKLAQQQEIQQRFKSQAPINTAAVSSAVRSEPVRDLTASLMDADLMGRTMNGALKPNAPLLNSTSAFSPAPFSSSNSALAFNGKQPSGGVGGKNAYQSLGSVSTTTNVNRGSPTYDLSSSSKSPYTGGANTQAQKPNYTAFDSLLSPSGNQSARAALPQQQTTSSAPFSQTAFQARGSMPNMTSPNAQLMNQQSSFGTSGMMGTMGHMQNAQPMVGNMRMNQPMMMNNMPMNPSGGMGNYMMGNTGMLQPNNTMAHSQQSTKKLTSQDLADFLG